MYEMRTSETFRSDWSSWSNYRQPCKCGSDGKRKRQWRPANCKKKARELSCVRACIHPSIHRSCFASPHFSQCAFLSSRLLITRCPPALTLLLSHSHTHHPHSHSHPPEPPKKTPSHPPPGLTPSSHAFATREPPPRIRLSATTGQASVAPIFFGFFSLFLFVVELRVDRCAYDRE
ncbi:hypothetical protein LZ30DRAFT_51576 [Colletotrichum cereale]|nr:hypothetical protein LZ30DRAFT_51576 [Colletotrichum cereale]